MGERDGQVSNTQTLGACSMSGWAGELGLGILTSEWKHTELLAF